MVSVLDGPIFGTVGCGSFPTDLDRRGRTACTALNVVGWVPVASIFSGIARGVVGAFLLTKRGKDSKALGKVWLARGATEICCVGFLIAPADIACSAVRSVKNKRKAARY
jgi:hypothetical protein